MQIPFDVSYHFNNNLQEVPNFPNQMAQAVAFLKARLQLREIHVTERLNMLGLVGVLARILGDLATAQLYLITAIALSEQIGNHASKLINQLRLAHVYQWQRQYTISNNMFTTLVELCEQDSRFTTYLDFVYQHAGKNAFDQYQYRTAEALFQKALTLRLQKQDQELISATELALKITQQQLAVAQAS